MRTIERPAPVALGMELHLFLLDPQRRIVWNRFRPREGWSEWQEVPDASWRDWAHPHPIRWGGQLHVLLVGPDRRIRIASRPPEGRWSRPQAVPGAPRTAVAPSATATRSALVVAATTESGRVCLTRRGLFSGWHPWVRISDDQFTAEGPALCALGDRLYTFVTALDGSVHFTATR